MIEVTTSIDIARPLPEVFGFVSDPFSLPRWNRHITSVMVDAPGPTVTGSRFRVLANVPSSDPIDITYLVTRLVPNDSLEAIARAAPRMVEGITVEEEGWIAFQTTRRFHDLGGSTRVEMRYIVQKHPLGGVTGWSDRILQRRTTRDLERNERSLKKFLESRAPAGTSGPASGHSPARP
jgi:uncharacterized membrane protein